MAQARFQNKKLNVGLYGLLAGLLLASAPHAAAQAPAPRSELIGISTGAFTGAGAGNSLSTLTQGLNDALDPAVEKTGIPDIVSEMKLLLDITQRIYSERLRLEQVQQQLLDLQDQFRRNPNPARLRDYSRRYAALQKQIEEILGNIRHYERIYALMTGADPYGNLLGIIQSLKDAIRDRERELSGGTFSSYAAQSRSKVQSTWRDPALAMAAVPRRSPYSPFASRWGLWAQARSGSYDRSGPTATDGTTNFVNGGVHYRLLPWLTAGVAIGHESQRFATRFNGGYFNGNGTTIAPYVSLRLSPNVKFNLSAGYTDQSFNTSDGVLTGTFGGSRSFGSASLVGTWYAGAWRLSPRATVFYATTRTDAFTDSGFGNVPASTNSFGRFSIGPEVGYGIDLANGSIEPYVFALLEHDFGDRGQFTANGFLYEPDTTGARVGGGVKLALIRNWTGAVGASYNSLGRSNESAWTLEGRLSLGF